MKMLAIVLFVVLQLVLQMGVSAAPSTLHMKKHAPSFEKHPVGTKLQTTRKSIPMNGGLLTLGAYFLELEVGTGAGKQVFNVIVDTGSSNTAVPSVGCQTCGTNALYDANKSSTSAPLACNDYYCQTCTPPDVKQIQQGWIKSQAQSTPVSDRNCLYGRAECTASQCGFSISYGGSGSSTQGTIVTDKACFNGTEYCATIYVDQITNQAPAATQTTGIIGFAYPANGCNPTCQPTILDSMVDAGVLTSEENKFGMCLTGTNGGKLDLGYFNYSRYQGDLQFTKVVTDHWYNIEVKDLLIAGTTIGVPSFLYQVRNDAIGSFVDSGTSVVIVSPITFSGIQNMMLSKFAHLPHVVDLFSPASTTNNCANINATEVATYPRFDFVVAGMDGKPDFHVGMDGSSYLMSVGAGSRCLGIAGIPSIGAIFGDVIMQNYYIAFDRKYGKLGFAPIQSC